MRQANREVKDINEIIEIIRRCDVCRIALNDDGFPYILPLNFGLLTEKDRITLFFHSAPEGYKVDLIKKDNRASFEMDCRHQLQYFKEKGYCTMAYESVIGQGHIRILNETEKEAALKSIMEQYHPGENTYFNPAAIQRTLVYCLEVERITAKRKLPK
ncbi:MAG: pyridoxamine 5'-phosphate oxidase family protein [Lachnospiraceae bacterium]